MAPPDECRSSFARFVMIPAPRGEGVKRGGVSALAWERLAHSAALLGYGQLASFVTVLVVAWMGSLEWTEENGDDVPRLNNWTVLNGMILPFMVFYTAGACFNLYQSSEYLNSGPRFVIVPLLLGLGLVPTFYGILAAVLSTETDSTYYGVDYVMTFAFFFVVIVFDVSIRLKLTLNKIQREEEEPDPAPENATIAADDVQPEQQNLAPNKTAVTVRMFFGLLPLFATCGIAFAYPFVVIPLFFSSSVPTRIAICLFLHPVLLEAAEALGRGQKADKIAKRLRAGKFTLEVAEMQITQGSVIDFIVKQFMAFFRRFMLLNMGSPDATLIALVATAIEEAASRGFLVQIDTAIRALRGLPELEGDDLRLQRLVWMCDTNQSCIAEFNAILTSSFAQVLLQRHAVIFAIGYEAGQSVSTALVFVQLLVELTLELLVDNTAMWAESEHDIPVTRYFAHANGFAVFGFHASVSIVSFCISLYAFLRHPHFSSCASNDVCDCLDQGTFQEWVGEACATSNVSFTSEMNNATESRNSTSATEDPTLDLLDDVDFFAVTLALLSGVVALALIVLAVLFARYHKRKQAVVALLTDVATAEQARLDAEAQNKWLKESLQRAQGAIQEIVKEMPLAQLRPFSIKFAQLEFIEEIGHGSYGVVWKGTFRDNSVAIKTVRVTKVSERVVKDFMEEITLMAPLRHACLVRLIGGCWEDGPDNLCLVLEYCGRGSLKDLLVDKHAGHSWARPYFAIAHGVASCFRYFHHEQPSGEPIIHRDLKPDNVMICDDFSPRVGDLGESTRFDQEEALRRIAEHEGDSTPRYTAPEILAQLPYNKAVDVYSFGITLLEIGCGDHHFVAKQFMFESRYVAIKGWRPKPTDELVTKHSELWALIQACWHAEPRMRPSFVEIVRRIERLDPAPKIGTSAETSSGSGMIALMTEIEAQAAEAWLKESDKKFVAFLSHHKAECAADARLVKGHLEDILDADVFLDSDDLRDLRGLLGHVAESRVLVHFQSQEVLTRPWCLLELYTAVTAGVPIVALNCDGKDYDFNKSAHLLAHLDTELKPSVLAELRVNNVDPLDVAHALSSTIPNIISVPLNTSGSRTAIAASMVDLVKAMRLAQPVPLTTTREEWLAQRAARDEEKRDSVGAGTLRGTQKGMVLQRASRADELEAENASLKAEMSRLAAELSSARVEQAENASLKAEVSRTAEELSQARTELSEARAELSESRAGLTEARAELTETRVELTAERATRAALANNVEDLRGQLRTRELQVNKLLDKL